jgi:imidazolonepropionase
VSVEHLERIDEAGIAALADHGTVAVLLPGAQLYLRDPAPPVAALRAAGVVLALGTDLNPGSSPVHDPWAVATLATLIQGFTIPEAVRGITRSAGAALARPELGWLGVGSAADMAIFAPPPGEPPEVESLVQHLGAHRALYVIRDGTLVVG